MGVSCLILGHSGSGKSTSLRNFEPDEIGIFNVAGKPLPFRKQLKKINHAGYQQIRSALKQNQLNAYAIDDSQYLLAFENFSKAKQKGFDKFVDMAVNYEQMLEDINNTNDDTIVYVLSHVDYDDAGRIIPKSIGKMLTNQLCIEGLFPICLMAERGEDGYHFVTQTDGNTPVKAPMGMFDETYIDNDLKAVDTAIREYWDMAPLSNSSDGDA